MAILPAEKDHSSVFNNPQIPASTLVEFIASRSANSDEVYVYDDVREISGTGSQLSTWATSKLDGMAPILNVETRSGAGLSLVGRLAERKHNYLTSNTITAFASLSSLPLMGSALHCLPHPSKSGKLVLQVPLLTHSSSSSALSSSIAPLTLALPLLPSETLVMISTLPQEIVNFAQLAYNQNRHVIHIYDNFSAARETGHSLKFPPITSGDITIPNEHFYRYEGNPNATSVVVMINSPVALAVAALARETMTFGVVIVSIIRPWNGSLLREILPSGLQTLHVIDEVPNLSSEGLLYSEVLGSLISSLNSTTLLSHKLTPSKTQTLATSLPELQSFLSPLLSRPIKSLAWREPETLKRALFLTSANSPTSHLAHMLQRTLAHHKSISTRLLVDYDVTSKAGGLSAGRLVIQQQGSDIGLPLPLLCPLEPEGQGQTDFLAILDDSLLKSHKTFDYSRSNSSVLISTKLSGQELLNDLSSSTIKQIRAKNLRLFIIDAKAIACGFTDHDVTSHTLHNFILQLSFVRLYLGSASQESLVSRICTGHVDERLRDISLRKVGSLTWSALKEVAINNASSPQDEGLPLKPFTFNSATSVEDPRSEAKPRLTSWHDAARHIIFPEVFSAAPTSTNEEPTQHPGLHPEISDRTYLVTCTVNRRLTPLDYDRNVFHVEFDTTGTGLQYAIGEALGVHGWNDEEEVLEFCTWYGVDPSRLISIPVPNQEGCEHTRTVFQLLQQQVDIFGRPPKSFYTELAAYATNAVDKHALLFIGSPEGSSTFKVMAETDTVTFADVLGMYPSARPGIEILCQMVGDIKPRHYSIASAQSVVGNRVDLLVVTVEWLVPGGPARYGQCTRYLAGLKVGQKVTVSIKPSVMKLPPDNLQPLILAGLGTGAAPFRAFLQHRAWLVSNGIKVGPVYYYFGSRHQSQEYLYGEEIQAFIEDGIITKAGLAFSRDGPKKVYIQHKMLDDAEALVKMLKEETGVFYLCGPTWPVPDVYEALVNALVKYRQETLESADAYLESLKEEERYVLEVY